jgi:hypothetical protein
MKNLFVPVLAVCCSLSVMSCGDTAEKESLAESATMVTREAPVLSAVSASPEYADAQLAIGDVKSVKVGNDSAKVTFAFSVKNYDLKMQTADNENKQCNNSGSGQHIHFIMDEQPYKALYEPMNEMTLANGTEHYLMAFLSRSYHESVKSPGAAVVLHFRIDEQGRYQKMDEPKTPMVFYSRPKGDYLGKDTSNLLLDFYVWNCNLSADGYKVSATLYPAGGVPVESVNYMIDKWESKFINNLTTGKSKIVMTLVDKDGKQVEGPCTGATREFNMAAQEPMQ